ncbi:GNAT family N-acetyltransferase [Zoogloea dura]|uniref:GNAT family N-acetyltransferase n=1 Tax=Zoogloea dura TaxID=2728840 RepID=A0A848GDA0_9RHOO|nr:GNAT family protein [Zoogloea dura]NML27451.1 GNAT family N-acetyltransferase [Zoogloea dura]
MPNIPISLPATERIVIRSFTSVDAQAFSAAARESVETVSPWMPWCSASFSEDSALEWFAVCDREREAARAYDMGVFCRSSGEFLGGASINQLSPHHRYGNIGYWVRQSRQGQGIAKQVVATLCRFGFGQLALFRLEIVVALGNVASEAVAIATGATRECVARNRVFLHGRPADAHVFSLTPDDVAG